MTTDPAPPVPPDTQDWTWVLLRRCPQCGYDAAEVDVDDVGRLVRENAARWSLALTSPAATRRPSREVWSPTEYAAHVRDVHRVFGARLALLLARDEPEFVDWDQDATAVAERYDLAVPGEVGAELAAEAELVAAAYDAVRPDQRSRRGRRSNGSEFTVETLARYHLHDVVHHLVDAAPALTVAAYESDAEAYARNAPPLDGAVLEGLEAFASRLGAGARVLEIGSGHGRDAHALEARGLVVRRTDVTPAFVRGLRAAGHHADVLDPLTCDPADLDDPRAPGAAYDGVWANASLLHVARGDLPEVLRRLAVVTRPGGVLRMAVKEGDGEAWSTHGSITAPRRFVYWRTDPLREVVVTAGWDVDEVVTSTGRRDEAWLAVTAVRSEANVGER